MSEKSSCSSWRTTDDILGDLGASRLVPGGEGGGGRAAPNGSEGRRRRHRRHRQGPNPSYQTAAKSGNGFQKLL